MTFVNDLNAEFPLELDEYIAAMEARIVEELAFLPGSTFHQRVKELDLYSTESKKGSNVAQVQGPNALMIKNVIRRVGRLALERTSALCMALCQASGVSRLPAGSKVEHAFRNTACAMVDSLLSRHFDVLYNRHLCVIILGCIFCTVSSQFNEIIVNNLRPLYNAQLYNANKLNKRTGLIAVLQAKLHKIRLRWATLTAAATSLFPHHDAATLEEVPLTGLLSLKWAKKADNKNKNSCDSSDEEWESEEEEEETKGAAVTGSAKEVRP